MVLRPRHAYATARAIHHPDGHPKPTGLFAAHRYNPSSWPITRSIGVGLFCPIHVAHVRDSSPNDMAATLSIAVYCPSRTSDSHRYSIASNLEFEIQSIGHQYASIPRSNITVHVHRTTVAYYLVISIHLRYHNSSSQRPPTPIESPQYPI